MIDKYKDYFSNFSKLERLSLLEKFVIFGLLMVVMFLIKNLLPYYGVKIATVFLIEFREGLVELKPPFFEILLITLVPIWEEVIFRLPLVFRLFNIKISLVFLLFDVLLRLVAPRLGLPIEISLLITGGIGVISSIVLICLISKPTVASKLRTFWEEHFDFVFYTSLALFTFSHLDHFLLTSFDSIVGAVIATIVFAVPGFLLAHTRLKLGIGVAILLHMCYNALPVLIKQSSYPNEFRINEYNTIESQQQKIDSLRLLIDSLSPDKVNRRKK